MKTTSKKTKKSSKPTECLCGCGAQTRGGRFLPGHDAKLKKSLIEAALGGSKRAETKLNDLGWTKFLDGKRGKSGRKKPEAAPAGDSAVDKPRHRSRRKPEKTHAVEAPANPPESSADGGRPE